MTRKMEERLSARRSAEGRKRARRIIATLMAPLAALAFATTLTTPARALTVQEQGWQVANSKCNSGDAKQCELRDRLSVVLKRHGCVYHEDGAWWKCSGAR